MPEREIQDLQIRALTEKVKSGEAEQEIKKFNPQSYEGKMYKWIDETIKKYPHIPFDSVLLKNIYAINNLLNQNYSYFFVISGKEGEGKSTLAINIATIADKTFNVNKICLSSEEFIKQIREIPDGSWIQFDEAGLALYNRETMTRMNNLLNKIFMVTRQKRICFIFCLPSYFMLDTYIRDHRVDLLINIDRRGDYSMWDANGAKSLSINGRKYKNYSAVSPRHRGHFTKDFADETLREEYNRKKREHMEKFMAGLSYNENKLTEESNPNFTIDKGLISVPEFCKYLSMSHSTVLQYIRDGIISGVKIGSRYYVYKSQLDKLKAEQVTNKIQVTTNIEKNKYTKVINRMLPTNTSNTEIPT